MLGQIVGTGMLFFVILAGLWQLLWHTDIGSVSELLTSESISIFFRDIFDMSHIKPHLSPYEMGLFFSIFVMMQFWNMFNAKYFHTGRSLISDIVAIILGDGASVRKSYSLNFVLIAVVILLGQVLIVSFAGDLFSVAPLSAADWGWIMLLTSPVVIVPEIVRLVKRLF